MDDELLRRLREYGVRLETDADAIDVPNAPVARVSRRRRPRILLGVSAAVVVAAVALVVVLAAPSHHNRLRVVAAGSTSTSTAAIPGPWRSGVLGAGSWGSARTSRNERQILIQFVGGPAYEPNDSCSIAYRAVVTETAAKVRVRIEGAYGHGSSSGVTGCSDVGYSRSVRAELRAPLGSRTVIDEPFSQRHPVFDGSTLATPTWLPDGWQEGPEAAADSDATTVRAWQRSWYPIRDASTDGACRPTTSGIHLAEGEPVVIDGRLDPKARVVGRYEVGGGSATYALTDTPIAYRQLTWTESGRAFALTSVPGCVGDTPPSLELLLQFARGLVFPPATPRR